jgi:hypothetical protein
VEPWQAKAKYHIYHTADFRVLSVFYVHISCILSLGGNIRLMIMNSYGFSSL